MKPERGSFMDQFDEMATPNPADPVIDALRHAYDELQCYTLTLGDSDFRHQYVVDNWTLQHADQSSKPIAVIFALIGLYLHIEKGFSGRAVQQVHMKLARYRRRWPNFDLPVERGHFTVRDVMAHPPGEPRNQAIAAWSASIWEAYRHCRELVERLLEEFEII